MFLFELVPTTLSYYLSYTIDHFYQRLLNNQSCSLIHIYPHFSVIIIYIPHGERTLKLHIFHSLQRKALHVSIKTCRINHFIEKFSCFKPSEFVEMFISIYKCDRSQNYDLLCHIVVANDEQMRSQMERYSNIQKGVLVENSNHFTTHQFKREHVKQLKILAIFPK